MILTTSSVEVIKNFCIEQIPIYDEDVPAKNITRDCWQKRHTKTHLRWIMQMQIQDKFTAAPDGTDIETIFAPYRK